MPPFSSHPQYRPTFRFVDRSIDPFSRDRLSRRLHAHHREETQVRYTKKLGQLAFLPPLSSLSIFARARRMANAKINVLILTRLYVSLVSSSPPLPPPLPRLSSEISVHAFFFFHARSAKWAAGGMENGEGRGGGRGEGRKGVRKYTKRKAKRANFIWTRGGGKVHGEYHNAPAVPPFENRAETGRKL